MKCQNCGDNEANVRYTQIINGVKKQMNLCEKCSKELGIEDINLSMPISFSSFLGDMFDIHEDTIPTFAVPKMLRCDKCNMTYDEFLETGELGCDNCYEVFKIKLDSLLKNIYGVNRHVGRNGKFLGKKLDIEKSKNINENKEKKSEGQIKQEMLQERLKQEIKEERYEDAAKTRDEIKKIK